MAVFAEPLNAIAQLLMIKRLACVTALLVSVVVSEPNREHREHSGISICRVTGGAQRFERSAEPLLE